MYQPFKIRVNCEPNQCLCPNDDDARSINVNNKSYGGCGRKEKKRERKGAPPPTSSLTSQPRFGRGGTLPRARAPPPPRSHLPPRLGDPAAPLHLLPAERERWPRQGLRRSSRARRRRRSSRTAAPTRSPPSSPGISTRRPPGTRYAPAPPWLPIFGFCVA
jgi:hypothetical protein